MCGIFGVVSKDIESQASKLKDMGKELAHRGPDSEGLWVEKDFGLAMGHKRLAINDLSSFGSQPMESPSGRYHIAFNGEIYNFQKLKEELSLLGHTFNGHSDTEVLINAIDEWGVENALPKLRGMFAIALWDCKKRNLTLCRDRMGEKPLYYGWCDGMFAFASELKSLEALGSKMVIDKSSLASYFQFGYVPAPKSIYNDIYKLLPGTFIQFEIIDNCIGSDDFSPSPKNGFVSPFFYWKLSDVVDNASKCIVKGESDAISGLQGLLEEVVEEQSISDVPIGAFLSGGIDSSLVTAVMQSNKSTQVNTFTIGFKEAEYNEAFFAKDIANHLGTSHTELYIDGNDCLNLASKMSAIYDEPIADSSQIPMYLVSKLARSQVTVCLSGDGGDELFAGYNRYVSTAKVWGMISRLPRGIRSVVAELISLAPVAWWNTVYNLVLSFYSQDSKRQNNVGLKVQKIIALLRCKNIDEAYLYLISFWPTLESPLKQNYEVTDFVFKQAPPASIDNFVEKAMFWDQQSYLPGDNLTKVDRASMAVSLETRLPLLDQKIVEYSWRLPMNMKVCNGTSKWILRQVLYKYVPESKIERPKMGFSIPISSWLRGPLKSWGEMLMQDLDSSVFDVARINRMWGLHQKGHLDLGNQFWALLMYLDWARARNVCF